MGNLLFPHLHGLAWNVKRTPNFKTLVQQSVAPGWETRVSFGSNVIYNFALSYTILRKGYNGHDELSKLIAFFEDCGGQRDSFLFDVGDLTNDPAESSVTGQVLTIDGNNCAPLYRTKPGTSNKELIFELSRDGSGNVVNPIVKNDGTTLTLGTDYQIYSPDQTMTGLIDNAGIAYENWVIQFLSTFSGPITADFGWYYRVRFAQDAQEFEMFFKNLWRAQKVELVGTRV